MNNERKRDVPERDFPDIQDVVCAHRDDEQLTPDVACSQEPFQNRPVIDCRRYIFPPMRERGKRNETCNVLNNEDAGETSSDDEAQRHDVAGCHTQMRKRGKFNEDAGHSSPDDEAPRHDDAGCNTENIVYTIGMPVNAYIAGDPYLAGIVTNVMDGKVFFKFPGGRFDKYEYAISTKDLRPFETQFPNGVFRPIRPIHAKERKTYLKSKIRTYEARLKDYLNNQNKNN